jgi:endoglucanase
MKRMFALGGCTVAAFACCASLLVGTAAAPQLSSQAGPTAVRVNQTGYAPGSIKRATILSDAVQPLAWELRDSRRNVVASGHTTVFGLDADSGDRVHIADFSAWSREGAGYTLLAGAGVSHPFDISRTVFRPLKYDALAYFYQTRSGIPIEMPYAGGAEWVRPAGHAGVQPNKGDTRVPCAPEAQCAYVLDVSGGWYDAGDHGKYVVNGGIAVWTLLNQYERASRRPAREQAHARSGSLSGATDFADGTMIIPERNNGAPDLLDEARWELEFLMKMLVPAGQPRAGMAHHKVHDVKWTPLPTRPERDPEERRLRPVSTAATLNVAATAAQCARLWKPIDPAFSAKCLAAAETAWQAAQSNPVVLAPPSDSTGGGSYSDRNVTDERYWAASELYIATGKQAYRDAATSSDLFRAVPVAISSMSWNSTASLGSISLAVAPNGLPEADISAIRQNVVAAANTYLAAGSAQGYGLPLAGRYQWGSNSAVLNNALILALAFDFTKDRRYLDAVTQAMDYILGRNAMDTSYVSGYGERPMSNPHHRFWAKQADAALPGPPPGVLSGGPNAALQDPRAKSLAGCAPQKCYDDHYQAYSLNEVCLNWNAPLAWVAAWLDEHAER